MISVIIPALNEADSLGQVIAAVRAPNVSCEILVVDAGSSDQTIAIARNAGAHLVHSRRRQRAYQLNLCARQARGAILLFLHADTLMPPSALRSIRRALANREIVGGAFDRHYVSRSLLLRVTCFLAHGRNRLIGWHLGDQAMFVRAATFFQLGGFQEVDQFEDLDFSRRLRRFGGTVTLRPCVTSSSRRFDRSGPATTTLRDFALTIRYLVRGLPHTYSVASSPAAPAIIHPNFGDA
ncbi:MAG TPA: TIGR04283 family arsenosugar biosynthesis glycosyltransferase [Chthoniobacterales bacterium]|nr:TIGR04283 family arsenosugar biosynthesis glycosyltransferase [Chthoniobacterales bacterium]